MRITRKSSNPGNGPRFQRPQATKQRRHKRLDIAQRIRCGLKNHDRTGQRGLILLVWHPAVLGNQRIKSVGSGQREQFAVLNPLPVHKTDGEHLMPNNEWPQTMREILIEKQFHGISRLGMLGDVTLGHVEHCFNLLLGYSGKI